MPLPSRNTSAGRQLFSTPHCSHAPSCLRLPRKQDPIAFALMGLPLPQLLYNLTMRNRLTVLLPTIALSVILQTTPYTKFAPQNPFYSPSALPFHAPPFDKIKDEDYQPAIEAGMSQELSEIQSIVDNPAPPTFENTLVVMERSGEPLVRAPTPSPEAVGATTNPLSKKCRPMKPPSSPPSAMLSTSTRNSL